MKREGKELNGVSMMDKLQTQLSVVILLQLWVKKVRQPPKMTGSEVGGIGGGVQLLPVCEKCL